MSNTTQTAVRWQDADGEGFLSAAEGEVGGIIGDFLKAQNIQRGVNRRILMAATKQQIIRAGDESFSFGAFADWRGRLYANGAGLAPQGKDTGRGCLMAAEGRKLGVSGLFHLMVGVATTWGRKGLDKAGLKVRARAVVAMVQDGSLARIVTEAQNGTGYEWRLAEEPFQFLALATDLLAALASGNAFEYVSNVFIGYDATCSGLQILAAVTRCEDTARLVNVLPMADGSRADVYLTAGSEMNRMAKEIIAAMDPATLAQAEAWMAQAEAAQAEKRAAYADRRDPDAGIVGAAKAVPAGDHWALWWTTRGEITRSVTKRPVMVYCYGGGKRTFAGSISEETGAPWAACVWLAGLLYDQVLPTLLPKAHAFMKAMQDMARALAKAGKPVAFTADDGLPFRQFVSETEKSKCDVPLNDGRRLQIVLQTRTGKLAAPKQVTGVAPNIVHHWDSLFLRRAVLALRAAGIDAFFTVHDCFYLRAGDWAKGWHILRRVFVDTFSGNVAADLWEQIEAVANGEAPDASVDVDTWENEGGPAAPERARSILLPECPEVGTLDVRAALKSEFLFS